MALASVLAAAALATLAGCPSAEPQVEINGLMTCNYQNDALSNCALNPGATLDDLANSLLKGTAVTQ